MGDSTYINCDLKDYINLIGGFGCIFLVCLAFKDIINIFKKRELATKEFIRSFRDSELKKQLITIGVGFCIIVTITIHTKFGSTNIGGLFERINYTENYYVNLFPENSKSKNYKVEAEIEKTDGEYYLIEAHFPNGGYLTFYDSLYWEPLKLNGKVYLIDDSGNGWNVELTSQKCD